MKVGSRIFWEEGGVTTLGIVTSVHDYTSTRGLCILEINGEHLLPERDVTPVPEGASRSQVKALKSILSKPQPTKQQRKEKFINYLMHRNKLTRNEAEQLADGLGE